MSVVSTINNTENYGEERYLQGDNQAFQQKGDNRIVKQS